MQHVTQLLDVANRGDRKAAAELLPLVYTELRKLAAAKLAHESAGQTLDATGLVHEAYLRLVGPLDGAKWKDRGHFLAAAAEAMRRILIEIARSKSAEKRGGGGKRFELSEGDRVAIPDPDTVLAVDEALTNLEAEDTGSAVIARLRLFAGLSVDEAAEALGICGDGVPRLGLRPCVADDSARPKVGHSLRVWPTMSPCTSCSKTTT